MEVADTTGRAWLQGYHDVGLAVFDMSADELMEIKVCTPNTQWSTLNIEWSISSRKKTLTGTSQSCPS